MTIADQIKQIAAATGAEASTVTQMADFVARYVDKHFEGEPETVEDVEDYVVAGVMEFMKQRKRMTMSCLTRPAQINGIVYSELAARACNQPT